MAERDNNSQHRSPGPAAYNISVESLSPAYSFGTQIRPSPNANAADSPGPTIALRSCIGKHSDVTFRHAPAFGFGSAARLRSDSSSFTPGPGEYKTVEDAGKSFPTKKEIPATSFGTASRLPGGIPVPRRMDKSILQRLGENPSNLNVTNGSVIKDPLLEATPGPGAYVCDWKRKQSPAFSFAAPTDDPKLIQKLSTSLDSEMLTQIVAKTQKKKRNSDVPGPGHYKMPTTIGESTAITHRRAPGVNFGLPSTKIAIEKRKAAEGPGPGSYTLPSAFGAQPAWRRSLPQFTFGTTPRDTLTE